MLKTKIVFVLLLCCASLLRGQDARSCFQAMPDSLAPLLTAVNRADFIDFLDSRMKAEVTNRFDGKSEMKTLTDSYIRIETTPQSSWQMKLLPWKDSVQVICTVSTVAAPAADSHFRFYTTDWQPLRTEKFLPALPQLSDFIAEPSDTTRLFAYQEARRQADILFLKADLSAEEPTLTFTFSTPEYMSKEAAETLKPYLRAPIKFVWREGKFIRL